MAQPVNHLSRLRKEAHLKITAIFLTLQGLMFCQAEFHIILKHDEIPEIRG